MFRQGCAGLPTRDMNQQEWCEYMRDVKEAFHLTNAYIAKEADLSIKTVENIMALNYEKDILRATARRIELVVIGSAIDLRCPLVHDDSALLEQIKRLQDEVEYWKNENDRKARIIDRFLDN
jgi:hypothetical protein